MFLDVFVTLEAECSDAFDRVCNIMDADQVYLIPSNLI